MLGSEVALVTSRPLAALLATLALAFGAGPAQAQDFAAPDGRGVSPLSLRLGELLARVDEVDLGEGWFATHLSRMDVSDRYGLIYTQHLDAGAKGMRVRVRGPALRGIKRFGLSVELTF